MEKISNSFRALLSKYGSLPEFSWEIYANLEIIYTYHELSLSAYWIYQELPDQRLFPVPGIADTPEYIISKNNFYAVIYWLYTNGGIVLERVGNFNECVRTITTNEDIKADFRKISKEYQNFVIAFRGIRNNITAHPLQEWGAKNTRWTIPIGFSRSNGRFIFRTCDLNDKDFSKETTVLPYDDMIKLNEYLEKVCEVYTRFLIKS